MVKVRGWKREDLDQIASLWLQLAAYVNPMDAFYRVSPDAKKRYKTYLGQVFGDPNYAAFVAESDRKLIGFAMGRINRTPSVVWPDAVGYIENVFVVEEEREAGIGMALCRQLLDWFKRKRIGHVELFYQMENKEAAAFWKRMGFKAWLAKAYKVI